MHDHAILWDPAAHHPVIRLKEGILRRQYLLRPRPSPDRRRFSYGDERVRLEGAWNESSEGLSTLSLILTNVSDASLKIARLYFPAENGLDKYLKGFPRGKQRPESSPMPWKE